jgi:hypothetical protein
MKLALKSSLALCALTLLASTVQAGTHLSCTYLTNGEGAPYPGLSRPQVYMDEARAEVEIIMEAGRGTVSRVNYSLTPASRSRTSITFMDTTRQVSLVTTQGGTATLNVKGLVSRCSL